MVILPSHKTSTEAGGPPFSVKVHFPAIFATTGSVAETSCAALAEPEEPEAGLGLGLV
jgi:hypothetical protein